MVSCAVKPHESENQAPRAAIMECLLFQPHPHTKKKIPAECWRAKKKTCKRILEEKKLIVNQGVEKKIHD